MSLVVLDNASPLVNYLPSKSDWIPWEDESGRSYTVASANGSRLSFEFHGTGITLYGRSTTQFQVYLDDLEPITHDPLKPEDFILFSADSLSSGYHNISLVSRATASQQLLAFDQGTIETSGSGELFSYYDNRNASAFSYNGQWNLQTTKGVPNATVTSIYHTTSQLGANVTFTFAGGTTILVRGMLDTNSGPYTVDLDGNSASYNSSSSKLVGDSLIFYRGGLDPTVSHTVILTNTSPENKILSISSVSVQEELTTSRPAPPSSTNTKSHNLGVIVGAVLGVLLILCGLAWLGYRKHWTPLAWIRSRKGQHGMNGQNQAKTMHSPSAMDHFGSTSPEANRAQRTFTSMVSSSRAYSTEVPCSRRLSLPHDSSGSLNEGSLPNSPTSALFSPLRDMRATEALTPPRSPMASIFSSSTTEDQNGMRVMTWSRRESIPLSETSSTALLPVDFDYSKGSGSNTETPTATPASRKSRPLPAIPDSQPDDAVEEERDAGLYNEGTLMRLLNDSISSGIMRSDPFAPPPRYEARK